MKFTEATLPTLGSRRIRFNNESEIVWDYLGKKEIKRLNSLAHLGIAAEVFTGVNHSRLEYALLQCALIDLIQQFYKGNEQLALSGSVRLQGGVERISSGSELHKCWALLSNHGHTRYTYAVENIILQRLRDDKDILAHVLGSPFITGDIRQWANTVIENYDVTNTHNILAIYKIVTSTRVSNEIRIDLLKWFKHLFLDPAILLPTQRVYRYKIFRLQDLYSKIRLLSMVALDAYYSHHPMRLILGNALSNLDELIQGGTTRDNFESLLMKTGSWLAKELYLESRVVAARRYYEYRGAKRIDKQLHGLNRKSSLNIIFRNIFNEGLGQFEYDRLISFCRLTLTAIQRPLLGRRDVLSAQRRMEADLCEFPKTLVALDLNPFERVVYADFMYDKLKSSYKDLGKMISNVGDWLCRYLKADIQLRMRALVGRGIREEEAKRISQSFLDNTVVRHQAVLEEVLFGVIRYLLPEGVNFFVSNFNPNDANVEKIRYSINCGEGLSYDNLNPALGEIIKNNPNNLSNDDLFELKAMQKFLAKKSENIRIACYEKIIIKRGQGSDDGDEWDGVVLDIGPRRVVFSVIEAKKSGTPSKRETQALNQLADTKLLLTSRHNVFSRRHKIQGYGASLNLYMK